MALLVLGLLLWCLAHFFPRIAPGAHDAVVARVGAGPARGITAGFIFLGLVLIVIGFRSAPFVGVYDPPAWGIHLNNLMMFGAVLLLGMRHSRGRARSWLRHPMLIGVMVWALAHLLVNGDGASIVLFGTMLVWAVAEIALINRAEPAWVRPAPGPIRGDVRLLGISVVLFAVIIAVHTFLGYPPFPH